MARRSNISWLRIVLVLALSLVANIVPLPAWIEPIRPDFVALAVLWLCILSPRPTSLGVAWAAGLAQDLLQGLLLGQHALALTLMAFVATRMRLRIRAFPLLHQSGAVLALLWISEFMLFWIDGIAGYEATNWMRWVGLLTGAAAWPLVNGIYARLMRPA